MLMPSIAIAKQQMMRAKNAGFATLCIVPAMTGFGVNTPAQKTNATAQAVAMVMPRPAANPRMQRVNSSVEAFELRSLAISDCAATDRGSGKYERNQKSCKHT